MRRTLSAQEWERLVGQDSATAHWVAYPTVQISGTQNGVPRYECAIAAVASEISRLPCFPCGVPFEGPEARVTLALLSTSARLPRCALLELRADVLRLRIICTRKRHALSLYWSPGLLFIFRSSKHLPGRRTVVHCPNRYAVLPVDFNHLARVVHRR
jgi:hypothetical protein